MRCYTILDSTQATNYTYYCLLRNVYCKVRLDKRNLIVFWNLNEKEKEFLEKLLGYKLTVLNEVQKEKVIVEEHKEFIKRRYAEW